jgi:hypothetical protein
MPELGLCNATRLGGRKSTTTRTDSNETRGDVIPRVLVNVARPTNSGITGPSIGIHQPSLAAVEKVRGRKAVFEGRMPVQRLTSENPRLCGEDGKDDKLAFPNCWLRALCGPGPGDGRLWLCISSQQAQKDAQTPTTIPTPASLRCWADPARSILIQLRALALGWRGGGARKEGNQSSRWTAMEGGDSYRALVVGGQVRYPIGLPAVTSRSLPTHFMPSRRLKASTRSSLKLSLILIPSAVLGL